MIAPGSALSIARQAKLLGVSRSSVYYRPQPESQQELDLLKRLDELFTENPMYGSRRLQAMLKREGILVGRRRIGRLMKKLGLWAVGPKPNTRKSHPEHTVYPYLLRDRVIDRPNQVWATDITYQPVEKRREGDPMRGARSAATEKTSEASFSEGSPSGDAGATDQIDRRGRTNEVLACAETSFGEGSHRLRRCEVKRPEPTPRNTADGPPQSFFNSLLYPDAARLSIPVRHPGLGNEAGTDVAPVEHPGHRLLHRGTPEIFNTDQGSQFTSAEFTDVLKSHGIQIRMDGRGRCHDNIFVERLWWTIEHEWVYLHPCDNGIEQKKSLARCFEWYNRLRPHQSLGW